MPVKKKRKRTRKTKLITEQVNTGQVNTDTPEVQASSKYEDTPAQASSKYEDTPAQVHERAPRRIRHDFVDLKGKERSPYLVRDREKELQRFKRKGYQFVKPDQVEQTDGTVDTNDNVVRFGDRVAMWIPNQVREEWQAEKARRHYERDGKLQREAEKESEHKGESGMYTVEEKRTRGPMFNIPMELKD